IVCDERTMSAVLGSGQSDAGIAGQGGIGKAGERNEGIVLRGQHKGGNSNFTGDAQCARPGVVIGGAAETAVRRRDDIVEFAKRAPAVHRAEIELPGKSFALRCMRSLRLLTKCHWYTKFSGNATASAHTARSMQGHTAATPRNWRGAASASSPAIFSTKLPPMEYPAKTISESESRSMISKRNA